MRSIFEAIEILVKQMASTSRLTGTIVQGKLKEICWTVYTNDQTAKNVIAKMLGGFAQWVDAIHNYRHGQPAKEPVAPPVDLAIYTLSSGTSFLRWLIEINNILEENKRKFD